VNSGFVDMTAIGGPSYFYRVSAFNDNGSTLSTNIGSALVFGNTDSVLFSTGSNQYVDIGAAARFQANQPFSLSLWVLFEQDTNNTMSLIASKGATDGNPGLVLYVSSQQLRFKFSDGGNQFVFEGTDSYLPHQYYHIVLVYNGNGTPEGITAWVNGVQDQPSAQVGASPGTITYINDTFLGSDDQGYALTGYLDEVSIWNTALGSSQIVSLYNNGLPTNLTGLSGLVDWYRMGEGATPPVIPDLAGSFNGTMTNGPVLTPVTPVQLALKSSTQIGDDPSKVIFSNYNSTEAWIPYYDSGTAGTNDADLYDLTNSTKLGSIAATTNGAVYFGQLVGKILYLTYYKSPEDTVLQIYDTTNSTSPQLLGSTSYSGSGAFAGGNCLVVNGNYVYIPGTSFITNENVMLVIDATDLTNPVVIQELPTPDGLAYATLNGSHLYVSTQSSSLLQIFDVSSPGSPSQVGSFTMPSVGITTCLSPDGNTLYAFDDATKVSVINITNRVSPSTTGTISLLSAYTGAAFGDILYTLSTSRNFINAYNVSNLASPVLVNSYTFSGSMQPIWISIDGNLAYVLAIVTNEMDMTALGYLNPMYIGQ